MPDNKFTKQNGQLERKIDLTGQKEFYREGANIFDASNERRITLPDWKKDWTGRATEIDSPQAIAPRQPIASEQQQPSQSDTMAMLMTGILNKAQGASYKDLLTKKRGLQREVLDRQTGETPESLRGNLSFAEMQGLSDRKASALSSDIDRNQAEIQEFELLMDKAKSISEDFAKNMKAPESIMNNYIKAFEEAPQTFDKLISTMNEKTFQDFIGRIDFKKLAEPKAELKPTSGIQEYQFAQQQGFTGSFLDFERDMSAAGRAPKGGGDTDIYRAELSAEDINNIEQDLNADGLIKTLLGRDEEMQKVIRDTYKELQKREGEIQEIEEAKRKGTYYSTKEEKDALRISIQQIIDLKVPTKYGLPNKKYQLKDIPKVARAFASKNYSLSPNEVKAVLEEFDYKEFYEDN